jgi:hypothetical protein
MLCELAGGTASLVPPYGDWVDGLFFEGTPLLGFLGNQASRLPQAR